MTAPSLAAISATFSDYRLVKTRSVISLIFEVPIERQAEVFATLGFPMPGQEIHCGIARLQPIEPASRHSPAAAERPGSEATPPPPAGANPSAASLRGKERYANASDAGKAVTRAAILCGDRDFRIWLSGDDISVSAAAQMIREACGVDSRGEFGANPAALKKFQAIDTEYRIAAGLLPEPR